MNVYFFFFAFNTEIQDGCQIWRENDFWEKSQNKSVIQNKLSIEQLIFYYRLILYHPEILSKFCTPFCNILSQLLVQNKSAK